ATNAEDHRDHQRHVDAHQVGDVLVVGDGAYRQAEASVFHEHVQTDHQHESDRYDPDVGGRQRQVAELDWHAERHREWDRLRSPDEKRHILQHDGHAEPGDDHAHASDGVATASLRQSAIEQPLDDDPDEAGQDHRHDKRHRVVEAQIVEHHEPDERAQHINLAVGEMENIEPGIDQGNADRHEGIDHA